MKTHVEKMNGTDDWCVFRDLPEGGEEYLHRDGTWHKTTDDDAGTKSFPGIFSSEENARAALHQTTN